MEEQKKQLEIEKLRKEVQVLELEIKTRQSSEKRKLLMLLSIIIGILASAFGTYQALAEVKNKNKQLAIESEIRSHEIFLNQVIDRRSGTKSQHEEMGPSGKMEIVAREYYGRATQQAAYTSAVTLAKNFKNLRPVTHFLLNYQLRWVDPNNDTENEKEYIDGLIEELNYTP